jgi:hypothetical protein
VAGVEAIVAEDAAPLGDVTHPIDFNSTLETTPREEESEYGREEEAPHVAPRGEGKKRRMEPLVRNLPSGARGATTKIFLCFFFRARTH